MTDFVPKLMLVLCFSVHLGLWAQPVCEGTPSEDLLSYQGFGAGVETIQPFDPYLSPELDYQSTWPLAPGAYSLIHTTAIPSAPHCWITAEDNSMDESGYFVAVHTDSQPAIAVEQAVEWCSGGWYTLSADLINLSSCTPATVAFLIDSTEIYTTGTLPADSSWATHEAAFEISPATSWGTIRIMITGEAVGLDNLSLRYCQPDLALPDTLNFCAGRPAEITLYGADTLFSTPFWQWQRSFDGGTTWANLPGASSPHLQISDPAAGVQYRLLGANSPVPSAHPPCLSTSNVVSLVAQEPVEVFQTPVICEGDTAFIGTTPLFEAGHHTVALPGSSGCDSIVQAFLLVQPTYEQWFVQHLCPGEVFLSEAWEADTLLTQFYQTTAGCDSVVTYEIEVADTEPLIIRGDTAICAGQATNLTAPDGYLNYQWNTGAAMQVISVNEDGPYQVTFANSQGCQFTASINVEVQAPLFDLSATNPSCPDAEDGQIAIPFVTGGTPPYAYQLNNRPWQATPQFEGLPAGDYLATVQDANGCTAEAALFLEPALPVVFSWSGFPSKAIEAGDTLSLQIMPADSIAEASWSGRGWFSCPQCPTTDFIPMGSGPLRVDILTADGCAQQLDTTLKALAPYRLYLPTAFTPNGDGQNDQFAPGFGSNVAQILQWEIYDRWGGLVHTVGPTLPGHTDLPWDGTRSGISQPGGPYLYQGQILFEDGSARPVAGQVLLIR